MINYIADVHGYLMVLFNSPLLNMTMIMVKAFIPSSSVKRSIALLRRHIAT